MATFFTSRVDALKLLDGTNTIVIGSVSEVGVVGAGVKVFDPLTGKAWTASANAYPTGWTEETETLPTATTEGSILRYDADTSSWVTTDLITVDPADDGTPTFRIGKSGSALTGLQLMETGGGIAVISYNATGTKVTIDKNVDVTGTVTASSSITGTAVTATTGDITATAGAVAAGTTVTAGTDLVATGILNVNGTAASDITGALGVGASGSTGIVTLTHTSGTTVPLAPTAVANTLLVGTGSNGIVDGLASVAYPAASDLDRAAPIQYVNDGISAIVSGVSWKGLAQVITGTGTIRDTRGGSRAITAADDLDGAVTGLNASDYWFFSDDSSVLLSDTADTSGTGTTLTVASTAAYTTGQPISGTGIVAGTTITVTNGTTLTLSNALNNSGAPATTITIYKIQEITVNLNNNGGAPTTYGTQIAVGDKILVATGTHRYYSIGAGFVISAAVNAAEKDAYGVVKDLINTPDVAESFTSIYVANATPAWVKIGEFASGQIQDGTVANSLPTWNTADATWKQFNDVTLTLETSPVTFNQIYSGNGIGFGIKGDNGVSIFKDIANSRISIDSSVDSSNNIYALSTVTTKRILIESRGKEATDKGITILQTSTTSDADIEIKNQSSNGLILLDASADNVQLVVGPNDTDTGTTSNSVADVSFIRENVVRRIAETDGDVTLAGFGKATEFSVVVTGASGSYSSKVHVVGHGTGSTQGTHFDATEYAIVAVGTTPTAITYAFSASGGVPSIQVTATGSTNIAITAIPIA